MILQYRTHEPIPELGAHAGDTFVIDVECGTIEIGREIPAALAARTLAPMLERLSHMAGGAPLHVARAILLAMGENNTAPARRRGGKPQLRVLNRGKKH